MSEPLLYKIVKPPLCALFRLIFRPEIIGKDNIPENGRVILAGNHISNLDCFTVACGTRRCVHFMAKSELTNGIFKNLFLALGVIPVNRGGSAKGALINAEKRLNEEKLVAIFPEGTLNKSKAHTLPFRKGAVRIARSTDSFIVPFAISGKYRPFLKRLRITFMPPIPPCDDLMKANLQLTNTVISGLNDF